MFFINHKAIKDNAPELALYSSAFKFGEGLFETIRVYEGKPVLLEAHFARLFAGMYYFNYRFQEEEFQEGVKTAIYRLILAEKLQHARLRLQVFRSDNPLDRKAQFILEGVPLLEDYYKTEQAYFICDFRLIPLQFTPLSGFKLSNRLHYQFAMRYANENHFQDAVLFQDLNVAETSTANLFIVRNKKCITPPLSVGCLNGIMRNQVLKLCKDLKIPTQEKKLKEEDLFQADEVFLTNTIRGIIPVKRYKDIEWANTPLPMTTFLRNSLRQWMEARYGD